MSRLVNIIHYFCKCKRCVYRTNENEVRYLKYQSKLINIYLYVENDNIFMLKLQANRIIFISVQVSDVTPVIGENSFLTTSVSNNLDEFPFIAPISSIIKLDKLISPLLQHSL